MNLNDEFANFNIIPEYESVKALLQKNAVEKYNIIKYQK